MVGGGINVGDGGVHGGERDGKGVSCLDRGARRDHPTSQAMRMPPLEPSAGT